MAPLQSYQSVIGECGGLTVFRRLGLGGMSWTISDVADSSTETVVPGILHLVDLCKVAKDGVHGLQVSTTAPSPSAF